jgi:glycosyltransferase involved in cell wall biosynthesis
MKILLLTHYYPPEVNAPASRLSEMARLWTDAGHSVTVVTTAPSHPRGKVYPGYRNRLFQRERRDGVDVIRIWTFLAPNQGSKRMLGFLSYPLSLLLNIWRLPDADVVISTSPQFFCGMAGWLMKRRQRPWVLEIRDLWPKSIVVLGAMKEGLAIRALERIERAAYRHADALVSVTDSFVAHLKGHGARGPVGVIKNGVDLNFFDENSGAAAFRQANNLGDSFIAAYVGTHGMAHGLETILDAAELLRDDPKIVFLMVGDGSERERLEGEVRRRGLHNVRMLGQRPKQDMPGIWGATDVSLVLLRGLDIYTEVLPSKMFEAMAMRRPMILGVRGEAKALLEAAEAGIAITPESARELADTVRALSNDHERRARMGQAGRSYVEQHFDRRALADKYLSFLQDVIGRPRQDAGQPLENGMRQAVQDEGFRPQ